MDLIDVLFARALIVATIDGQIQSLENRLSASANVNEEGLISFKNSDGTTLFTLQLPLYAGAVEDGGAEIV